MIEDDPDAVIRRAAFRHVRHNVDRDGCIEEIELRRGFDFGGQRMTIVHPQMGIHKPARMRFLLSIKTVFPRPGGRVWYDDQQDIRKRVFESEESLDYAFMSRDPKRAQNRHLRAAMENEIRIIYFLGVAPGRYQVLMPSYITAWDADGFKAGISFGLPDQEILPAPNLSQRRYALSLYKRRLHDTWFKMAVSQAYDHRCAISRLRDAKLVEVARILPIRTDRIAHFEVRDGLLLSRMHHAAFEEDLIGIDADYRLHLSERLSGYDHAPMLDSLVGLQGTKISLPERMQDRPHRDRLAMRFERFKERG
ncbi:HNH endonuclease [Thioalkalivibrio sp. HK1]|uniref:HNH endonuclease n=1 Tax=Thioalkalivibrio sp. HK1 TaxID=1469245 RepID=UPI00057162F1|nr:HNH endonuclease [Thioalkalivibrio sp. HK1]